MRTALHIEAAAEERLVRSVVCLSSTRGTFLGPARRRGRGPTGDGRRLMNSRAWPAAPPADDAGLHAHGGADAHAGSGGRLRTAFDANGRTVNVELTFGKAGMPRTYAQLLKVLTSTLVWDWDAVSTCPSAVGTTVDERGVDIRRTPIAVSHVLQHTPHAAVPWTPLATDTLALVDGDQIYVFRKYQSAAPASPIPKPFLRVRAGGAINLRNPGWVCIAADLFGRKVNYKMTYDQLPPCVADLLADCERLLRGEAWAARPDDPRCHAPPPLVIDGMIEWRAGPGVWAPVAADDVVLHAAQMYCVVRDHVEVEAPIPEALLEVRGGTALASISDALVELCSSRGRAGQLALADLESVFARAGLSLTAAQYHELFETLPSSPDGHRQRGLTLAELCHLASHFPSVFEYALLAHADYDLQHPRPHRTAGGRNAAHYYDALGAHVVQGRARHAQEEQAILRSLGL